jgi:hypothetical protein
MEIGTRGIPGNTEADLGLGNFHLGESVEKCPKAGVIGRA